MNDDECGPYVSNRGNAIGNANDGGAASDEIVTGNGNGNGNTSSILFIIQIMMIITTTTLNMLLLLMMLMMWLILMYMCVCVIFECGLYAMDLNVWVFVKERIE